MSKLVGHSSVNFNNEFILIFGGLIDCTDSNQNGYSDQVKFYEISSQSYIPVTISESEKPSPRNFHSAIVYENKMIIFGGKSNGYLNDVWQFEFCAKQLTGSWKQLSILNQEIISPRFGHSAEIFNDSMFVFGGYDSEGFVSNQLFELNLKTLEWKCWEIKNSSMRNSEICARYFHSSVIYNNLLIICGGKQSGSIPIDDLLCIDLENWCEKQILNCKVKKIPQKLSRYGHSVWMEKNRLFMIGGFGVDQNFTNLYSLDLQHDEWREEHFHFLSSAFSNFEIGPVFHTLTTYKVHEQSSLIYFFLWGGKYQQSKESIKRENYGNEDDDGQLSILNEDILRIILGYLTPKELNTVQLLRKNSHFSQLSIEDKLWKKFYLNKVIKLDPLINGVYLYNFTRSLNARQQFKNHLIEIKVLGQPIQCKFIPKQEILKYDIQKLVQRNEKEREFRVLVTGSSNVGKTTMQMVLSMNEFPSEYVPTIFETEHPIPITIQNQTFTLQMIDTAGGYDYDIIRHLSYSPPPHLTIATYSIYNYESLLHLKNTFLKETRNHSPKTPILLLGTKKDLREFNHGSNEIIELSRHQYYPHNNRKIVSNEEGENFGREFNFLSFTEISSFTMEGIEELKELIVKCCLLQDSQIEDLKKPKCVIQ